jgi:hypothetical protein
MDELPPYVSAYAQLSDLFVKIQEASVPSKFTQEYMKTMLQLKSSNYFPMLPFLKRIGFLDQANVPTQNYRDYRDRTLAKAVMAKCIRQAYEKIFQANEFAYKLNREDLSFKVITLTGLSEKNTTVPKIVGTFMELCKLSDFESKPSKEKKNEKEETQQESLDVKKDIQSKLGISYTINLNLPPTTDIEVFNAIFKSLKENILYEK